MIEIGKKYGAWKVLKPSGKDMWELTNGKKVIRLSTANIEAKNFRQGELMYIVALAKKNKKAKPKRKVHVKTNKTMG